MPDKNKALDSRLIHAGMTGFSDSRNIDKPPHSSVHNIGGHALKSNNIFCYVQRERYR